MNDDDRRGSVSGPPAQRAATSATPRSAATGPRGAHLVRQTALLASAIALVLCMFLPGTSHAQDPPPAAEPALGASLLHAERGARTTGSTIPQRAAQVAAAAHPATPLPTAADALASFLGLTAADLQQPTRLATALQATIAERDRIAEEVHEARTLALALERRDRRDRPARATSVAADDARSDAAAAPRSEDGSPADPDAMAGDRPAPEATDEAGTDATSPAPETDGADDAEASRDATDDAAAADDEAADDEVADNTSDANEAGEAEAEGADGGGAASAAGTGASTADPSSPAVREAWRTLAALEADERRARERVAAFEALIEAARRMQAEAAERYLDASTTTVARAMSDEILQERQRLDVETQRTTRLEEDAARARAEAVRARERANTELERDAATEVERLVEELTEIATERRAEEGQQATLTSEKEAFLLQRSEYTDRLRAIRQSDADPVERQELAWRFYERVRDFRRSYREEALTTRARKERQAVYVAALARDVGAAQAALDLLETSTEPGISASTREALVAARRSALAVAIARHELAQWRLDLMQQRWALARQKTLFYAQVSDQIIPVLSRERRAEVFAFTADNLREERYNFRDRLVGLRVLTSDRLERTGEFVESLLTLEGLASLIRLLGASIFVIALLFALSRFRIPLLSRAVELIPRVRWARRNQRVLLKLAELARDLARPVAIYFSVALVRRQLGADVAELELLKSLVQTLLLYVIIMTAARTLLLPRKVRGKSGSDMVDIERFGIDLLPLDEHTAALIVRTLKVWLIYTIGASFASAVIHFVFGESLTAIAFDRLFLLVQIALVYAIVWWWRDVIVDQTLQLTRQAETPLGQRLQAHRDRPWIVLLLVFLAIYVLGARLWAWSRVYLQRLEVVRRVRNFLFRKKVERSQQEKVRAGESIQSSRAELPASYVAAFDGSRSIDDERYVPRLAQRMRILDLFHEWRGGQPGGTLITAEWGMGKSVFLERVLANLPTDVARVSLTLDRRRTEPADVITFLAAGLGLGDVTDEAELIERVKALPPTIVAIEDCERLFLRRIRGFDGLDTFLKVVSSTSRHLFWLVTFDTYAWQYVNRVRDRAHHIQLHVRLPALTDDEARELIRLRANDTGVSVDFSRLLDNEEDAEEAALGGTGTAVVQTEAGFYRLLNELAEGNPRVLQHYWLSSLVPAGENRVWVRLFDRPAPTILDRLSVRQLFALTSLAQHQQLRVDEIAETIAAEPEAIELDAARLRGMGLVRVDDAGRIRLSTHYFRATLVGLRVKNMLYYRREEG